MRGKPPLESAATATFDSNPNDSNANGPPIRLHFTQHTTDTDAEHCLYRIPDSLIAFGNEMCIRVHRDATRAEIEACFRWCNLIAVQFWHTSDTKSKSEHGHLKPKRRQCLI